jgi:UPF0042 nucleotide-binding protein
VVVLTGLSGAGRRVAAGQFEDLGWEVVDNVPAPLMPPLLDLLESTGSRMALTLGSSRRDGPGAAVESLRARLAEVRVLYLEATTAVLVRRFDASRRRHPLADAATQHLTLAIDRERDRLAPVRAAADVVLDTSDLTVHQLRRWVRDRFAPGQASTTHLTLLSFGYKHGLPLEADVVLDCRFLANPQYVPELSAHSGLHPDVRAHVLGQVATAGFLDRWHDLLRELLPAYAVEGRDHLTIALGCTGGRHRSVAIAEGMAQMLRTSGHSPSVVHRDVHREGAVVPHGAGERE